MVVCPAFGNFALSEAVAVTSSRPYNALILLTMAILSAVSRRTAIVSCSGLHARKPNQPSLFGQEVDQLGVEVTYETDTRLHVRVRVIASACSLRTHSLTHYQKSRTCRGIPFMYVTRLIDYHNT